MRPIDILMLDDSSDDIFLAKEIFRREKVANRLHCFQTEEDALEYLKENSVDLILVDINLRCGNGLDFIAEARIEGTIGKVPVVVVSGSQDPDIAGKADLLGVSAWIDKPLSMKKLHYLAIHIPELFMAMVMKIEPELEEIA